METVNSLKVALQLLQDHIDEIMAQCKEGVGDNVGNWASEKLLLAGRIVLEMGQDGKGYVSPVYAATAAGLTLAGHTVFLIGQAIKDYNTFVNLQRDYGELKRKINRSKEVLKEKISRIEDKVKAIEDIMDKHICPLLYGNVEQRKTDEFIKLVGRLDFELHMVKVDIEECLREMDSPKEMVDHCVALLKNARSTSWDQLKDTLWAMGISISALFAVTPLAGLIGSLAAGASAVMAMFNWTTLNDRKTEIARELASIIEEMEGLKCRLEDCKHRIDAHVSWLRSHHIIA